MEGRCLGVGGALAENGYVRLLEPVINDVHKRLNFLESCLIFLDEGRDRLPSLLLRRRLVAIVMEFQLSLPLFANRLELARFVHLAKLTLRLLLQSFEVLLPLAEVFCDGKEQLVELCLRLFRLGHLLARSQLLLGEVKLLQACSLLAERRLYLSDLFLILEHINANPWRSLRLDFLFIIKIQIFVNPVVQDEHELLDLVKEFLVLVVEVNQLGVLLFVHWLKIDLKLLLPFLLQVL